jgi:hypothetical protein
MANKIVIASDYLGLPLNFCADDEQHFFYCDTQNMEESWLWTNHNAVNSLRHISLATSSRVSAQPPASHVSAWDALGTSPPWAQALPPHVFKKWLQKFSADLLALRDQWADSYYGRDYQVQQRLLQRLQQPHVDINVIKQIDDDRVSAFKSTDGVLAPRSTYDIWSSVTGRMSICEGPNILTLDKQYRKIFKSRYADGKILQIDFTSLEPCVCLAMQGKKFNGDAYAWAAEQVEVQVPREVLKTAIMSALYGMTPSNFAKKFADIPHANDLLFQVRDAFGVDSMTKKLREQFDAVGHITNHFGRIIKCEKKSPFVAYAVQSTAVDVVCQGFTHLLDELESDKIEMTSLYLIHDALMVDLPPESAQHLEGRIKDGIFIPTLNCKMPLKLKTIDA